MNNIQTALLITHTVIAMIIIILVLLQRGKGADAGAGFGAGASGTVFGARGSGSFFSRATGVLATVFFATSLTLAYFSSQSITEPESLLENAPAAESEEVMLTEPTDDDGFPELPAMEDEVDDMEETDLPTLPADEADSDDSQ